MMQSYIRYSQRVRGIRVRTPLREHPERPELNNWTIGNRVRRRETRYRTWQRERPTGNQISNDRPMKSNPTSIQEQVRALLMNELKIKLIELTIELTIGADDRTD